MLDADEVNTSTAVSILAERKINGRRVGNINALRILVGGARTTLFQPTAMFWEWVSITPVAGADDYSLPQFGPFDDPIVIPQDFWRTSHGSLLTVNGNRPGGSWCDLDDSYFCTDMQISWNDLPPRWQGLCEPHDGILGYHAEAAEVLWHRGPLEEANVVGLRSLIRSEAAREASPVPRYAETAQNWQDGAVSLIGFILANGCLPGSGNDTSVVQHLRDAMATEIDPARLYAFVQRIREQQDRYEQDKAALFGPPAD